VSITFAKRGRGPSIIPCVEIPQRVKMSDVARTAGVSVATVSKVVNGRWGVAQATVDRVQQVIDQMGYEASLGAQSLRSSRTNVLGILVAEFEPFSTELLKGASSAVGSTDYELLAYSGGHHGQPAWQRLISRCEFLSREVLSRFVAKPPCQDGVYPANHFSYGQSHQRSRPPD